MDIIDREHQQFIERALKNGAVVHFSELHKGDAEMQFLLAVTSMSAIGLTPESKVRALRYILAKAEAGVK